MYQMCSGVWNFKGKPDASYQIAKYRAGRYIYIYIYTDTTIIDTTDTDTSSCSIDTWFLAIPIRYFSSVQFSSF